jgi:hypothetical protein
LQKIKNKLLPGGGGGGEGGGGGGGGDEKRERRSSITSISGSERGSGGGGEGDKRERRVSIALDEVEGETPEEKVLRQLRTQQSLKKQLSLKQMGHAKSTVGLDPGKAIACILGLFCLYTRSLLPVY